MKFVQVEEGEGEGHASVVMEHEGETGKHRTYLCGREVKKGAQYTTIYGKKVINTTKNVPKPKNTCGNDASQEKG